MTELNDELLVAYADGQLAKDQSKAVERVLEEDQFAAQRVEALRAANAHLETQFEAMLAGEPIPGVTADLATGSAKARPGVRGLLGRAVLLAWVGFGGLLGGTAAGYIYHDQILPKQLKIIQLPAPPPLPAPDPIIIRVTPPPPNWQDAAAQSYALLSRESFSLGEGAQSNRDLVGFQFGKALDADFAIPDLTSANFTFVRGQLLQRDGKPLAQISYLPETGSPVVLFALAGKTKKLALEIKQVEGSTVAVWATESLSFLLAGNFPETQLRILAQTIQSQQAPDAPVAQSAADNAQGFEASQSAPAKDTPNQQN